MNKITYIKYDKLSTIIAKKYKLYYNQSMKKITFTNTLGKTKQELKPLDKNNITMYHCGPTVYWTQHIGNLRAVVMADLVVRTLSYLDYKVKLVRNYTDVGHLTSDSDTGQDKMEKAAKRESLSPDEIAQKYIDIFEHDIHALGVPDADVKPRATKHVNEMIAMVQELLKKEYAYTTDLAVYFDVSKANDYTKLSGQNLEENIAHAGTGDVKDDDKKNPADFALWFFKAGAHANALQTWSSPFTSPLVQNGEGFPGWHIECSAMAQKHLGNTIDIHMGGIEHIPVHHTNEIAQSEHATGEPFANIWLHNEHLTVDDKKMAKSEGTSFSLQEIVEKGFDPLALRYFFLQAHYRSKQNFTWEALASAQTTLNKLYLQILNLPEKGGSLNDEFARTFTKALSDDVNTPQALAVVWDMLKSDIPAEDKYKTLMSFDEVLGLSLQKRREHITHALETLPKEVSDMMKERDNARNEKNWPKADSLRDAILEKGFWVEDTPDGTKLIPKL
ncbi:MAG: cysteine--tRNA ligase [Patescibacteria group bacterium]